MDTIPPMYCHQLVDVNKGKMDTIGFRASEADTRLMAEFVSDHSNTIVAKHQLPQLLCPRHHNPLLIGWVTTNQTTWTQLVYSYTP